MITIPDPNNPQLSAFPTILDFGNMETTLKFWISNSGSGLLTWNLSENKNWINLNPTSGTTETETDEFAVNINRLGLTPGTFTGTITVNTDGGNQNINVSMTIPDEPSLSVSPTTLDFGSEELILTLDIANAGTGDLALPVELTSFTVEATIQGVLCKWTTQSEIENLGFILERKTEGADWSEIASYKTDDGLMGQGTTSSFTDYENLDNIVQVGTEYEYRLADVDYNGAVTFHATRTVTVEHAPLSNIIEKFTVLPAYPNPFNPSTTIRYELDSDSYVTITIYDITGQLITTLRNAEQSQGWYSVVWNGTNKRGDHIPAGLYLSRITSDNEIRTTKLMLLK